MLSGTPQEAPSGYFSWSGDLSAPRGRFGTSGAASRAREGEQALMEQVLLLGALLLQAGALFLGALSCSAWVAARAARERALAEVIRRDAAAPPPPPATH